MIKYKRCSSLTTLTPNLVFVSIVVHGVRLSCIIESVVVQTHTVLRFIRGNISSLTENGKSQRWSFDSPFPTLSLCENECFSFGCFGFHVIMMMTMMMML